MYPNCCPANMAHVRQSRPDSGRGILVKTLELSVAASSLEPQKALCGGIPFPFLEPSPRSWSHFVGVYRQILTKSLKN